MEEAAIIIQRAFRIYSKFKKQHQQTSSPKLIELVQRSPSPPSPPASNDVSDVIQLVTSPAEQVPQVSKEEAKAIPTDELVQRYMSLQKELQRVRKDQSEAVIRKNKEMSSRMPMSPVKSPNAKDSPHFELNDVTLNESSRLTYKQSPTLLSNRRAVSKFKTEMQEYIAHLESSLPLPSEINHHSTPPRLFQSSRQHYDMDDIDPSPQQLSPRVLYGTTSRMTIVKQNSPKGKKHLLENDMTKKSEIYIIIGHPCCPSWMIDDSIFEKKKWLKKIVTNVDA
eukprot:CAMPEP_0117418276 /NCGR_PEP_ID=MMETSP0758-20121206/89_1 /TAXON_ID=63605 /ORGANISM="Percolomonas cosmopolitus, Strain AE-1 (ATCC 50343)" /LENGTH=280 /DNA_ID=CAMNT_0005198681 /DNA_START=167 /DNA_END=1009 /DNA_ORIENTATION=+